MSGHSKWHNIQATKNKADAARGKIFTKIGREIVVAVKAGGPDPNSNAKLRDIISKAKQNNMPNDNIQRSIKKASGELNAVNYEETTYEGYGVGGSAVYENVGTDNQAEIKNFGLGEIGDILNDTRDNISNLEALKELFLKLLALSHKKLLAVTDDTALSRIELCDHKLDLLAEIL